MRLTIPPLTLSINGLTKNKIPLNTRKFLTEEKEEVVADIHYTFHLVKELPPLKDEWDLIFERSDIQVFRYGELEARKLAIGTMEAAYAIYKERNKKEIEVYFLEAMKQELVIDTIFVSCLALERHFAEKGAHILHCCFLYYHGQAILFSGPSGIGKSTHANLWCQYITETHVVNGDRCLIYQNEKGQYLASAWPICGSSNICFTETYPLKTIVFMGQAPHNEVVNVRPMQLFKQLSSQITINWWNKQQVGRTLDELQQMLGQVKMCNYACNLTSEAPKTLYNYLKDQEWIN
ncbi:MAG: hypothetical protein IJA95_09750 [Bacteroidaceae bacterium]|nr:hypothetical protein [Bacteroides sp.]MBQ4589550.1 hypothetical protein [Bacteroidaceae bacterium]